MVLCYSPVMGNPSGVRRDFRKLEERRLLAARLLRQGVLPAEVARQVGVHRQSVSRWAVQLQRGGVRALNKASHAGWRTRLRTEDLRCIERGLKRGPRSAGLRDQFVDIVVRGHLIEQECGVQPCGPALEAISSSLTSEAICCPL